MKYEDLFKPENVLILARITDKTQKLIESNKSEPSLDDFERMRRSVFKKDMEAVEAISKLA